MYDIAIVSWPDKPDKKSSIIAAFNFDNTASAWDRNVKATQRDKYLLASAEVPRDPLAGAAAPLSYPRPERI